MNKRKVRVGIVGVNYLSSMHEAGYAEIDDLCELVAFCANDEALACERAALYQARAYTHYEDLLADPGVDLVDITTPLSLLSEQLLATLEAGKHLFLEKPLEVTAAQFWQLHQTALDHQVHFTMAEYTRFVAAYQETAHLLQSEQLGDIRFIRAQIAGDEESDDSGGRSSAEATAEVDDANPAIHILYLLTWLFGDITNMHRAAYKLLPESSTNDHRLITGHLPNGTVFTLTQNCLSHMPWSEHLEIHGSLGSLIVDQLASPPMIHLHSETNTERSEPQELFLEPLAWKYLATVAGVQDVIRAIQEERPALLNPLDIYHALQALEASQQSSSDETAISLTRDESCPVNRPE